MNGDFRNILISVGETSSDLGFFFEGENTETITDYSFVVNWIAFLIRHGESCIEPLPLEIEFFRDGR